MDKVIQGCRDGATNNFLCYSSSDYQQGNNNTYVEKHEQRSKSRKRERVTLSNGYIMIPNFMDKESNGSTSVKVDHHYSNSRFQDVPKINDVNDGGQGKSTVNRKKTNYNRRGI